MRSPRLALFVLAAALAVANLWVTLERSAIPVSLDGTVTRIEVRFEKNRGVDDVYLVTLDGRTIHVDPSVGRRLARGDHVSKDAWARTIRTPDGTLPLSPSVDFRRMLVAMPLVGAAITLLLARRPETA